MSRGWNINVLISQVKRNEAEAEEESGCIEWDGRKKGFRDKYIKVDKNGFKNNNLSGLFVLFHLESLQEQAKQSPSSSY